MQPGYENTTDHAYKVFKESYGYLDDDIYYLQRNINHPNVDSRDTLENISWAITSWLKERNGVNSSYFIFIVGPGTWGLQRSGVTVSAGVLTPSDLGSWLNINLSRYDDEVILIDSSYAGIFLPHLDYESPTDHQPRIIMTSTEARRHAYCQKPPWEGGPENPETVFSREFFNSLGDVNSYGEAWEAGDHNVYEEVKSKKIKVLSLNPQPSFIIYIWYCLKRILTKKGQCPKIDDSNNGVGAGTLKADFLPLQDDDPHPEIDGILAMKTYP
jgi:hypothetical protein